MWIPRFVIPSLLLMGCALLFAEERLVQKKKADLDVTKTTRIEVGANAILADSASPNNRKAIEAALNEFAKQAASPDSNALRDRTKVDVIELPTKRLVQSGDALDVNNPKVEPGLVVWHPNFETACAAAKNSGKPVLLFQMMGNLDDRFC